MKKLAAQGGNKSAASAPLADRRAALNAPTLTLTQEAYERLEEMIITLELAPGEAVSEAILSKRIGIGTTPIREALHRLARQYLVKIIPRRGVIVTAVDVRLHFEVLEVRREVDGLLARAAAARANANERELLAAIIVLTENAANAGDVREFLRLDAELNQWLSRVARNTVAVDIAATLHAVSRRFWFYHLIDKQQFGETAALHVAVARAIASGDGAAAAAASEGLIDYLVEFASSTLPGARVVSPTRRPAP